MPTPTTRALATALLAAVLLASAPADSRAQRFSVGANAADLLEFGSIGVQASAALSRHWSLDTHLKFNPWTYSHGSSHESQTQAASTARALYTPPSDSPILLRQQSYALGGRYWPWSVYSGWWAGAALRYQEYSRGGLLSPETEEGDALGGSLSAGYSLMLGSHFNIDFGLGAWAGSATYTTYACPRCGKVTGSGRKFFVLPSGLILSLAYIF